MVPIELQITTTNLEVVTIKRIHMLIVKRVLWILFWAFIIGFSLYFYVETFLSYFGGFVPENFKKGFLESKIWFIGHIAGASASLLLGPLQFSNKLRTRYMKYHRVAGKIFIIGSLIAAVCAFRINLMYDCKPCRVSLGILSTIWFLSTAAAWWAIKNKNIKAHRQFMVRSYTAALAFVFIRLFGIIGTQKIFPFLDTSTDRRVTIEWLCWVIPFMIIETYMVLWPSLKARKPAGSALTPR